MGHTIIKCKQCQDSFYIRPSDLLFYQKIDVPAPKLCPNCREQRRLARRNERTLHLRHCSKCKKEIVSIYAHDVDFPVYCYDCWMGDSWDAQEFGRDFDFSRPFFEQYKEIRNTVPHLNLFNTDCQDSEYTNQSYNNKNCYLCFAIRDCQHCFFSSQIIRCENVFDSEYIFDSKNCYECVDCFSLEECFFSKKSRSCKNCDFLYDCNDCEECIACVGLRGKKYHIFNKPYSQDAYFKFKNEYLVAGRDYMQDIFDKFMKFVLDYPRKSLWMKQSENSLGNNLYNSNNCYHIFEGFELNNCSYSSWLFRSNDCYDAYGVSSSKLAYESVGMDEVSQAFFCDNCECSADIYYSTLCLFSKHLFACISVRNNKYLIFNKKYKKEEYEVLKNKIIEHMKKTGEWGEFFPIKNSPYAYNVSVANDLYPLKKEEILANKWRWRDLIPLHKGEETISSKDLPDNISQASDKILDEVLSCGDCGRNYQIIREEFTFYQHYYLHLPEKCPDCRHRDRLKLRSPHRFWERECDNCGKIMLCTYPPEKPDIVFCRECYQKEVTDKQNGPPEKVHKK